MLYGIGKDVSLAKNSVEAMELSGLDWTVSSKKISVEGIEVPGYIANVKSDGKVLGIVSEQYKIIQNSEAFSFADILTDQIQYETAGSLNNDKKVWLAAKYHDIDILGQKVENYLVFSNCHDGKGSIRITIVPVMTANGNPMNIPLKSSNRSWSTTHYGDINKKMEQAIETLNFSENYLADLVFEAEKLSNISISEKQKNAFIERLFPINPQDGDRKIDNIKDLRTTLENCINQIDYYQNTAWQLINGVSLLVANIQPKRSSETFFEKKFNNIINGDTLIDKAYKILKVKHIEG